MHVTGEPGRRRPGRPASSTRSSVEAEATHIPESRRGLRRGRSSRARRSTPATSCCRPAPTLVTDADALVVIVARRADRRGARGRVAEAEAEAGIEGERRRGRGRGVPAEDRRAGETRRARRADRAGRERAGSAAPTRVGRPLARRRARQPRARRTPATGTTSASWSSTSSPADRRPGFERTGPGRQVARRGSAPAGGRPGAASCWPRRVVHERVRRPGRRRCATSSRSRRSGSSSSTTSSTCRSATLRLKRGGGDNGHNGLRSISRVAGHAATTCRVRFGIGRPPGRMDPADFVLRTSPPPSARSSPSSISDAADAVEAVVARRAGARPGPVNASRKSRNA